MYGKPTLRRRPQKGRVASSHLAWSLSGPALVCAIAASVPLAAGAQNAPASAASSPSVALAQNAPDSAGGAPSAARAQDAPVAAAAAFRPFDVTAGVYVNET